MTNDLKYTQNFLHSPALVEKIVTMAHIAPGDTVLEIGPGKGIITRSLAQKVTAAGRVVAVELDPVLAGMLRQQFKEVPQVEIMTQDIRQLALGPFNGDYAVFSNVPFNITSELLEYLFSAEFGPGKAHLILQKDTLIGSSPYGETETFKSLMIKPFYEIHVVHNFQKADFRPQPGVEISLFSFQKITPPRMTPASLDLYRDFLAFVSKDRVGEGVWKKAFTQRQLQTLTERGDLAGGRGLKSQTIEGIISAFNDFTAGGSQLGLVKGAMASLREEQKRREVINREGGHRRSNKTRNPRRNR